MNDTQQKEAARQFAAYWKDKGYEKGESQPFWLSLLRDVYGVEHPEQFITFEEQVHLDHTSFIDGTIPSTKVLIEQKGSGKDLKKPIKQSDGTLLTPFQQAKRYITELPLSQHPRWVVTCNFEKFFVYDMERPGGEPEEILLENLPTEYYRLSFLVDSENEHLKREMEVSIAAGEMVGLLYDAFHKQYAEPDSERALKSLNILCVRLVFCLYAEDAGIFGHHGMFHDYLAEYDTRHMRKALIELFQVLDTAPEDRDPYLKNDNPNLAAFPYVNGGLFANEDIEIPPFTDEIRSLLLNKASSDFNWSEISPTIFGAVFESTLNPETRRSGGMHYTSIENIHKVIDPLFLDDLKKEFEEICEIAVEKTRERKLKEFQKKLAALTFLDPACGSGNFLTETYISLRRLENEVLRILSHGQISFGDADWNPIQVSISQFYGIEINDFAVTVARTALWIAESQMMKETESIVLIHLDFLPLKTNANIVEGNALRMDWEGVVPKHKLSYIMGNPPFVGFKMQTSEQRQEIQELCGKEISRAGFLDYVCGWYIKTAQYIHKTEIRCAFVSTNSITQGEQPAILWEYLYAKNIGIDFAHRTFVWSSESQKKASVHCVIIGFSEKGRTNNRIIFTDNRALVVTNINPYLIEGEDMCVKAQKKPICNVPPMIAGNKTVKCLALIMSQEEKDDFVKREPMAEKYIKRMIGAEEFINNIPRYCLWLVGVSPVELQKMPLVLERVEQVRQDRLNSKDKQAHALANTPTTFRDTNNPAHALVVPLVSSERRRYIPIGYIDDSVIANNKVSIIPNGTLYQFGVLTSNVHNSWMRCVAMRMKSDYSYSLSVVYNTFPWPTPTDAQKAKIEQTAQAILDARALYPDCSLADMYGEKMYLFPELLKAHQNNDRAVMQAYGFSIKDMTESSCVAELMKIYQELVIR